jgi:hypothetical protein
VFRFADHDLIGRSGECAGCDADGRPAEALLRPVILDGELVERLPDAHAARRRAAESLARLPMACLSLFTTEAPYRVEYSEEIRRLQERLKTSVAGARI